jgi:hypothetical protein
MNSETMKPGNGTASPGKDKYLEQLKWLAADMEHKEKACYRDSQDSRLIAETIMAQRLSLQDIIDKLSKPQ